MIVELIFTLKEEDYPYQPPFSTIIEKIDAAIGYHVDSGISFIEPIQRDIGWEAKDLTEVDLMLNSMRSILDSEDWGVNAEVVVRTSSDMLRSPYFEGSSDTPDQ